MIRIIVILAFLISFLAVRPTQAQQVCFATPSDSVPADVAQATYQALASAAVLPSGVACYAISNVSQLSADEFMVSIVGVDTGVDWNFIDNAVWTGMAAITRQSGALVGVLQNDPAFVETVIEMPIDPETIERLQDDGIGGITDTEEVFDPLAPTDTPYFPFASGSSAIYGIRGVHSHGNLSAVDFLGYYATGIMPNAVYAAHDGAVTSICRDDTQMGLRIGPFYYLHLVNNPSIVEGQYFSVHDYIGALVAGSFDDTCGYAEQQATHYHLHFAFSPDQSGGLYMESWRLDVSTEEWTYVDGSTREAGQLIGPSDWNGVIPEPAPSDPPEEGTPPGDYTDPTSPPTPGGNSNGTNFWTFLVGGFRSIVSRIVAILPQHQSIDLAVTVGAYAALPIQIVYITGVVNYTLAFVIVGLIVVLEFVRFIYSIWMWIKRAIPVVG